MSKGKTLPQLHNQPEPATARNLDVNQPVSSLNQMKKKSILGKRKTRITTGYYESDQEENGRQRDVVFSAPTTVPK